MPGEPFTCILQVLAISQRPPLSKSSVYKVLANLNGCKGSCVNRKSLNESVTEPVSFSKLKDYIVSSRAESCSVIELQDKFEDECWRMCKNVTDLNLPEYDLHKLWQIFNRLLDEDSFPPQIQQKDAKWLCEKFVENLDRNTPLKQVSFENNSYTFTQYVQCLNDSYFGKSNPRLVSKAIKSVHDWLVKEVLKAGWVYQRVRKQANWTNWRKRWLVLMPGKMQCSQQQNPKYSMHKKEKFYFTEHTTVTNLEVSVCGFKHVIKLSELPGFECELAIESNEEKASWFSSFSETKPYCMGIVTPVQKLLKCERKSKQSTSNSFLTRETSFLKSKEQGHNRQERKLRKNDVFKRLISRHDCERIQQQKEKIRTIFLKIDKNGNGVLSRSEFSTAMSEFGLSMQEKDIDNIFQTIDQDNNGKVTYDEFYNYFVSNILDGEACKMKKAFLEADRKGKGTLNFKEFSEFVFERHRSICLSKVISAFQKMSENEKDEVSVDEFKRISLPDDLGIRIEDSPFEQFENRLKSAFDNVDPGDVAKFIKERWNKFESFRRSGANGDIVMKGERGVVDVFPGEYQLIDLACFSDLPPLIPKHTTVKSVQWNSSQVANKSGNLIFPGDFDGNIAVEFATSELLRYYGCSFADEKQECVSLLYRHAIQDFTYENDYLSNYVEKKNGGAGLEKHDFSHLDCPFSDDSGYFILAKFQDDEFHMTAFKIPKRHTLYIPGGCIHSNDYLRGTWRTLLSDEAEIDHVFLKRKSKTRTEKNVVLQSFTFRFEN